MLASSFLDPVLGLDIHFEMVPTPAPVPLPIPNPFIGLVFDPIGLAAGIAIGAVVGAVVGAPFQGPVLYWTAFPATNTGTEAKHVPGHFLIPPGTMWAPFPKTPKPVIHPGEVPAPGLPVKPENDAVVITGSKTVTVMGSNAVRLGDIALSCSEPLRLPSSVVLAIPKGAPILIGGPMSLDIMSAIMASLRTRFVSDSLHALISRLKPSRFRNFLHRAVCFFTGHPVDVASGKVMTEFVDIELPGPIPLKVERIYSSAFASRPGPLGHGWSLSLDQALWRERGKVVLLAEDGREIEFDTFDFPKHRMDAGQKVYNPIERLTLHCDEGETWRVVDHEGVVRQFAPVPGRDDGRAMIQKVRSRCGYHEITFHYGAEGTARGRLEWVRDSGGRLVRLRWDAQGRMTELHLPQPQGEGFYCHRRYEYDAAGDLVAVTDSLGHAWRFAYVSHLLTQETDRNGLSFYFQYDGLGEDAWCVRTWGDGGIYDHVLSYDKRKRVTFVTNSLGYTTQYHMNLVGQVVKVVDPLGGETKYEHHAVTLAIKSQANAIGTTTSFEYDSRGNRTAVIQPGGARFSLEYHPLFNAPVRVCDPEGHVWDWAHDSFGRVTSWRDPLGTISTYHYDHGRLVRVQDSAGNHVDFVYDSHGTPNRIRTPSGKILQLEYDSLGRLRRQTMTSHASRVLIHDLEGNVLSVHDRATGEHRFAYDAEGNLIRAVDRKRDVCLSYTGFYWPHAEQESDSKASIHYDTEGKAVLVENAAGEHHRISYDAAGRVATEVDFCGARSIHQRDIMGRLVAIQRSSGRRTTYAYDALDRLTEVRGADGSFQRYSYRADGALAKAESQAATVLFDLNPLGRVLQETTHLADGTMHVVTSHYDADGQRVQVETNHGHVHNAWYAASGALTALEAPASNWSMRIARDDEGREVSRQFSSGASAHWTRDHTGYPTTRTLVTATPHRTERTIYDWHPSGRLAHRHDDRLGSASYFHDHFGRLTSASHSDGAQEVRLIDPTSPPRRKAGHLQQPDEPAGPPANSDVRPPEYDADGNLVRAIRKDGTTIACKWNDLGQLEEVTTSTGLRVCFQYDALDRRVSKSVHLATDEPQSVPKIRQWAWDGDNPLVEIELGGRTWVWIFSTDDYSPFVKLEGSDHWSSVSDINGAATAWFNGAGEIACRSQIGICGEAIVQGDDDVHSPFRWPGQYEDQETGLFYNRFRYYDPEQGCYISKDPLGLAGSLSPWGYVDDPLIQFDPLGLIEHFFRFVSEAEARQSATNLGGNGRLNRRPHGDSLGRGPKWITQQGGEPRLGKGTRPDWIIRIEADDGTLAWLQRNGVDFDEILGGEAAVPDKVLLKSNEPGSFGVGIGLLDEFNARIKKLTGSKVDDGKKSKQRCT